MSHSHYPWQNCVTKPFPPSSPAPSPGFPGPSPRPHSFGGPSPHPNSGGPPGPPTSFGGPSPSHHSYGGPSPAQSGFGGPSTAHQGFGGQRSPAPGGFGGPSPAHMPSQTPPSHASADKLYPPNLTMVTNPQVVLLFLFSNLHCILVIIAVTNFPQNPSAPPIYPCGICHKEVAESDQVENSKTLYCISVGENCLFSSL